MVEVQLRLLVLATHIGCIIGRRGDMIRSIRDDTGAHVKVHEGSQGARPHCPRHTCIKRMQLLTSGVCNVPQQPFVIIPICNIPCS